MRINAYLARHTKLSRRKADKAIEDGRVEVNGHPAEIGQEVVAEDIVSLDNKTISTKTLKYVVLNKPTGYITSRKKNTETPIVYELLPNEFKQLKPAGRLDKDTEGLLLFTNDGNLIQKLTHPGQEKEKKYFVTLDIRLKEEDKESIEKGIRLEDGMSRLEIVKASNGYIVTIREGRNRQLRRTFGALDYRIDKLKRVKFGPLELRDLDLKTGEWKEIPRPVI